MLFEERQRVRVHLTSHAGVLAADAAARVLEVRNEPTRNGLVVQAAVRVEYEVDCRRRWHSPNDLELLDECALGYEQEVTDASQWQKLSLRCSYSFAPLTDPARYLACRHPSKCNFDSLQACMKAGLRTCPVVGCVVNSIRSRDLVRDDALCSALAGISTTSAEHCWLRGKADVRLSAPDAELGKDTVERVMGDGAKTNVVTEVNGLKLRLALPRYESRTGYVGVVPAERPYDLQRGNFVATYVVTHGTAKRLGVFATAVDAAVARARFAEQEDKSLQAWCTTPGCTMAKFHVGPCSGWSADSKRSKPIVNYDEGSRNLAARMERACRRQCKRLCCHDTTLRQRSRGRSEGWHA